MTINGFQWGESPVRPLVCLRVANVDSRAVYAGVAHRPY